MIDSRINADTDVCFRSDSDRSLSRRSSVTRVGGRYTDLVGLLGMSGLLSHSAIGEFRERFVDVQMIARRFKNLLCPKLCVDGDRHHTADTTPNRECFHLLTSAYGRRRFVLLDDLNISQCDVSVKGEVIIF